MTLEDHLIRCRPWIEAALEYSNGTHDFMDVANAVLTGNMQLWANEKGCVVTEVLDFPKKRILHIFLAGGQLDAIRDLEDSGVEWAKSIGCSAFTLTGRRGWDKALKNDGWEPTHTMMIKRI